MGARGLWRVECRQTILICVRAVVLILALALLVPFVMVSTAAAGPGATVPEIERLLELIGGRWRTRVVNEPSPRLPEGGRSEGWEESRAGPGRASLILETASSGPSGGFEGAGFITWNPVAGSYELYWLSSASPEPGRFRGRWQGMDLVFDGYEYIAGQRLVSRHSITGLTPSAFVYFIDLGVNAQSLRRATTIHYTRA
jgi:hypothetical protein